MATTPRLQLTDLLAFLLLVGAAAGARAWYLNAAAENAMTSGPIQAQDLLPPAASAEGGNARGKSSPTELDVLVGNIKDNNQFVGRPPFGAKAVETAHVAPGYPYFLALLDRLSSDADHADQLARWVHAGLGALTAGFYYLIAVLAFRSRVVGVLAGLFCAVHPFWIVNTAAIDDGVLTTFLLGLALCLGTRGGVAGGALTSLLYGLALAALALVRAALLPFAIVGLLWFLIRSRELPRGWLCGLVAFLGLVIGLVPWGLRNWQMLHEVVPIVDSTYLHVWMGYNPRATGGPMSEEEMANALIRRRDNQDDLARRAQLTSASTSQQERHRILGEAVHQEMRDNPSACVRRRIWAGLSFFFGSQFLKHPEVWVEGDLMATPGKFDPIPAVLGENLPVIFYGSTLFMLALGVLGWRWTYAWRHGGRLLALATVFIPLPYILSHAEALVGPRLPLDGVLLTFAAFALACLIPGVGLSLFRGPEAIEEEQAPVRRLREERPHVRI